MKIDIRHAEIDDYKAIHHIYSQPLAYAGTLQLPYVSSEVWKQRLTDNPSDAFTLVASVEEEIVGSIGLFVIGNSLRRRHAGSIGMGIHDNWQHKGIGNALLEKAIDLSDNWLNLMRLELTVYTDNKSGVNLYKKFGFKIEGTFEKYAYRNGVYVDAYSMARIKQQ